MVADKSTGKEIQDLREAKVPADNLGLATSIMNSETSEV